MMDAYYTYSFKCWLLQNSAFCRQKTISGICKGLHLETTTGVKMLFGTCAVVILLCNDISHQGPKLGYKCHQRHRKSQRKLWWRSDQLQVVQLFLLHAVICFRSHMYWNFRKTLFQSITKTRLRHFTNLWGKIRLVTGWKHVVLLERPKLHWVSLKERD